MIFNQRFNLKQNFFFCFQQRCLRMFVCLCVWLWDNFQFIRLISNSFRILLMFFFKKKLKFFSLNQNKRKKTTISFVNQLLKWYEEFVCWKFHVILKFKYKFFLTPLMYPIRFIDNSFLFPRTFTTNVLPSIRSVWSVLARKNKG